MATTIPPYTSGGGSARNINKSNVQKVPLMEKISSISIAGMDVLRNSNNTNNNSNNNNSNMHKNKDNNDNESMCNNSYVSFTSVIGSEHGEIHFGLQPDWHSLRRIEDRRRKILRKVEQPFWRILLSWDGTCIRALLFHPLIWIPVSLFLLIRTLDHLGFDQPQFINFDDSCVDVLGGFVAFLLVLFVNQTNTRFLEMYKLSKKCCGVIQDVAGLVSTYYPNTVEANRLVRYMNTAHICGYVGLDGPYTKNHFFDHFNDEHNLLNRDEMSKLDTLHDMDTGGSNCFKELVTWCQREVMSAKNAGYIDTYQSVDLQNRVLDFRSAMDGIYDFCDQPVQFFYVHFLVLISILYLPLFAVNLAYTGSSHNNNNNNGGGGGSNWQIEILNFTVVLLQCIFVIGLRLLAQKMTDPYGLDLEDLSVMSYVYVGLESSEIILNANPPPSSTVVRVGIPAVGGGTGSRTTKS